MKRKTRKFASGGDILTGIGLGMIGYDLYKRLKGDDEKKEYKGSLRLPEKLDDEPPKAEPKEPKKETPEEYLEKRGAKRPVETGTRTNPFYKDDEDKPEPEPKPAKKVTSDIPKPLPKPAVSKSTPAPAPSEPKFKSYPKGVKGTHKDPFLTESYMSASEKQTKIQKEDEEKKKKAEEAKKKNKERKEFVEREAPSYKKGGSISSASKRGDGIAQRGKTKGRVC
jgi:hypothetical protein